MIGHRGIRIPIFLSLIVLLVGISARPFQQVTGEGDWYFPETKRTVSGEILDFYSHTDDYMTKFGYPISDLENHPVLQGAEVQYFQRARIELFPNEPVGKRIRLASLGVWLYGGMSRGKPADIPYVAGACRMFTPNNIPVCYDFLKFYDQNDGQVYFGEPISVLEELPSGRLVQYFERARMEWWPENPPGMRVVLTDVGSLYQSREGISDFGKDPDWNIPKKYQLKVNAFTAKPLVSPNGKQTIYVIVSDQLSEPVKGAMVTLVVHMPDGTNINHRLDETTINGLTSAKLEVGNLKPNQVIQVDVEVRVPDGAEASTSTYFRIWY